MRRNLYISGTALPHLRGNVDHALKVVGSPGTVVPSHIAASMAPLRVPAAVQQPAPLPSLPGTVGGCWGYAGIDGTPLVMPGMFPHSNLDVAYRTRSGCGCAQPPANPPPCSRGGSGGGSPPSCAQVPRPPTTTAWHQPVASESDPSLVWQSGFMPAAPLSYIRQLAPSYASAHSPAPFDNGPRPNIPCCNGVPVVGGTPPRLALDRTTGRLVLV